MSQEGQLLDKKSLHVVSENTANWSELAKDCIAFANALGGTLLFINPALLRNLQLASETTLKRIEPTAGGLGAGGFGRYPKSTISDIHQRMGGEIHPKQVKRTLEELTAKGSVRFEGDKRWRRYRMTLGDPVWVIHKKSLIHQQLL